jgi:hypothetical protein
VINNYTLQIIFEVPGAYGDGNADAGEDPDHAMDLDRPPMPGTIMRGHGAEDLADFFDLTFESSAFVEVTLTLRSGTSSPSNVVFRVLDHTKVEVVNFTMSDLDAPKRFAALTHSRFPTLRYYFGITWEGPENVSFEFRYELTNVVGEAQDDAGTGEDISNSTSGAESVSFDDPVTGTVGGTNRWGGRLRGVPHLWQVPHGQGEPGRFRGRAQGGFRHLPGRSGRGPPREAPFPLQRWR